MTAHATAALLVGGVSLISPGKTPAFRGGPWVQALLVLVVGSLFLPHCFWLPLNTQIQVDRLGCLAAEGAQLLGQDACLQGVSYRAGSLPSEPIYAAICLTSRHLLLLWELYCILILRSWIIWGDENLRCQLVGGSRWEVLKHDRSLSLIKACQEYTSQTLF